MGVLAGCGGPDLAKKSFPRSTVAAAAELGGGGAPVDGTPVGGEAAFTAENLRVVDACVLFDDQTMASVGTPANNRLRDFGHCAHYMKDKAGKELNFNLVLGESASGKSAEGAFKIGGLPANENELDDKTACFIGVITEASPKRAITLQISGPAGPLCEPGRKVMEGVIKNLQAGAPKLTLAKGTVAGIDPCAILDESTVTETVGETNARPTTLHACDWSAGGASFSVSFKVGPNPDDLADAAESKPVDLGGVKAQKRESEDRCRLDWAHAPFPADKEQAEVVSLSFSRYDDKAGDPCTKLEAAAKALIPKLPTG
ncbi:Protein of unknown function [Actinokineospora alba]|uniref:DUF3558 domain-containing protein n=1 Tax=Actinokineospora alba TaxID=504798 RepID=A0A1H0HN33_9PSEU|nr:hypothetical protein C8E96_0294 [Actinokineospora alba]SDH46720.1 Protein of unknown function [Actinokineospora alba]SDO20605.1 Protein of unknown function [Actinokineospora alba]